MPVDMTATEPQTAFATLELSRTLPADRASVYRAWTDPDSMRKWFAPGTMKITELRVDFREGGRYLVAMQGTMEAHNGTEEQHEGMPVVSAEGTYLDIVPEKLIRYTWTGNWNPGEQTIVTVIFEDAPNGTLLKLTHKDFGSQQSYDSHYSGWASSLDKLNIYLSTK